jgi:surfeit locus 1 family protein
MRSFGCCASGEAGVFRVMKSMSGARARVDQVVVAKRHHGQAADRLARPIAGCVGVDEVGRIDADASGNWPGEPVGGLTVVTFRNHHLIYALTWLFARAPDIDFITRKTPASPLAQQPKDRISRHQGEFGLALMAGYAVFRLLRER